MKIIIVDQKHGDTKSLVIKGWMRVLFTFCFLGMPVVLGYYGYQLSAGKNAEIYSGEAAQAWANKLLEQEQEVKRIREEALAQLQALTLRLANLQARLLRLDALGERLTTISELEDNDEFDFSQEPAMGGPELSLESSGVGLQSIDLIGEIDRLSQQIENRQQQLQILDTVLSDRQLQQESLPSGRPVESGWISSNYGRRIDPFTGDLAWHEGIDFATGASGVEVSSVASGIVTFAGERYGYGQLVEVNHGNGYESLYAHNQDILVNAGDIIKKGQIVALSGSTGRSTGPHVHFEIHKNGRVIDPASYINRTNR
jgi:murein DD-endopeptidase MepM/ murein hydrolase activator NlpD